jgi:hypothetical protein
MKFIVSDDLTPCFLDASDEFWGQGIQNRPSDEPTVHASVHLTPYGLATVWVKAQSLSIGRSDALTIGSSDGCL